MTVVLTFPLCWALIGDWPSDPWTVRIREALIVSTAFALIPAFFTLIVLQ